MNDFFAHILVVDDDEGIRSLVKKYLNENNYLVTTANNGEDASEKIKIIKFNLIILILFDASSAFSAVFTKNLFSFKYFLTNDLIPSSSSTTNICAIKLSIYYLFKNIIKIQNFFGTGI